MCELCNLKECTCGFFKSSYYHYVMTVYFVSRRKLIRKLNISNELKIKESGNNSGEKINDILQYIIISELINGKIENFTADKTGKIQLVLPDSSLAKEIIVSINLPGYQTYYYTTTTGNKANSKEEIRLQERELMMKGEVRYIPEDKNTKKSCTSKSGK